MEYKMIKKNILLRIFILFIIISCANDIDLSTPEATIKLYHTSNKIEEIKRCFYQNEDIGDQFKVKIWSEYKILDKKITNMTGDSIPVSPSSYITVKSTDVEIITEVKMIHQSKNNPWTKYWYLLSNFNGQWKIIAYDHIPDKNYPPLD